MSPAVAKSLQRDAQRRVTSLVRQYVAPAQRVSDHPCRHCITLGRLALDRFAEQDKAVTNPPPPFPAGPHQPVPPGYPAAGASPVPPGYPTGYGAVPPQQKRSVLGIVALVAAVIGFLFACIPGALIIGWILLPISFILGLVALFQPGVKWPAITAIAIAVVGTIVGAIVFLTVVSDAVDDAFGRSDEVTAVDSNGNPVATDDNDRLGSQNNPAPVGTTLTSGRWEVTLVSYKPNATQEVLSANRFNAAPPSGYQYGLAKYTVTYLGEGSSSVYDLSFAYVTKSGNVVKSYDNNAVTPDPELEGELYNGASVTGNIDFTVPDNDAGLLRVEMGTLGTEVFFQTR